MAGQKVLKGKEAKGKAATPKPEEKKSEPKTKAERNARKSFSVVIRACACAHQWQDRQYGPGRRAMNPRLDKKGSAVVGYRCTVCSMKYDK